MTAGARVAAFGALLAAIFALAAFAGSAIDPSADTGAPAHDAAPAHGGAPAAQRDELRLAAGDTTLTPGRPSRLDFAVLDERGERLRDFEVEQGRRMHLIVVRRDLRGFQHLHPTEVAPGAWTVTLTLPDAGVYHAFADFQSDGRRHALGVDLFAAGRFTPLPLPPASTKARTDGYDVTLGRTHTGALHFDVSRDGAPVTDLQPYLGASGHLVILRAGDLIYQHAHPAGKAGHTHPVSPAAALTFDTGAAAPGTYRLFLQFRHDGRVHTAAFTHEVTR